MNAQPTRPPTMTATKMVVTTSTNSSDPNQRIWTGLCRYRGRRSSNDPFPPASQPHVRRR